jgi:hypothetical protein
MTRCTWSEEEVEIMVNNYPHISTKNVAAMLGKSVKQCYGKANLLKLHKTQEYLASESSGRLKTGNHGTFFPKGNIPWNKGMKGLQIGGQITQFKKGSIPPNYRPVGSERIDEDGYTYLKIAEHAKWVLKHRHIYEQEHGKIASNMIVTFKDKNISNFDIENLEAITKVENMQRNTITKYPIELRETIKTLNKLWHVIK